MHPDAPPLVVWLAFVPGGIFFALEAARDWLARRAPRLVLGPEGRSASYGIVAMVVAAFVVTFIYGQKKLNGGNPDGAVVSTPMEETQDR